MSFQPPYYCTNVRMVFRGNEPAPIFSFLKNTIIMNIDYTFLKAWFFSALSYDEDKVQDYIHEFFPNHTTHFIKNEDGSHFYGLVTDEKTKTAYIVSRGTDGDNFFGNMHSWLHDFDIFNGEDGTHNGFQKLGDIVFNQFKDRLPNYKTIVCCGHSQGGGVSQRLGQLCCRHLSKEKTIRLELFSSPPFFNKVAIDEINGFLDSGRMQCNRWYMPGDPVSSKFLRDQKHILLNWIDIGIDNKLPDLIQYNISIADTVNHSCKMVTAGIIMQCAIQKIVIAEYYHLLGEIFKRCVN